MPSNKSPKKGSLVANTGIYLTANILNAAIPFLLLPILTRFLDPAEYGAVGMFQMVLALFGTLTGLSTNAAANREYFEHRQRNELAVYIGSCVQLVVMATCTAASLTWVFSGTLSPLFGLEPRWLMLAVFTSGAVGLIQLTLGQWQVRGQALWFCIFQVTQSVLNMMLSVWLVVAMDHGLEGRLLGACLPPLLFALIGMIALRFRKLIVLTWRTDVLRKVLGFGVPLIPHLIGLFVLAMFDRLVVNNFLGLEQIGIYMVAVQLSLGIGVIAEAANKAFMPWMFNRLKEAEPKVKAWVVRCNYFYFTGASLVAITAAVIAPLFIPWFAGPDYAAASGIFLWFAIGEGFNGAYLVVSNYIYFSGKTAILSWVTTVSGMIHVILVLLLVQHLGLEGAAMAFTLSTGLRFFLTWIAAQRCYPMPWFNCQKS